MFAAVLLGTSTSFLYQVVQPVSDVATTSWWTMSLALTVAESPLSALGAGLAASMAVLTRPNLVPLGAVIGLFGVWRIVRAGPDERRPAARRLMLFALGLVAWLSRCRGDQPGAAWIAASVRLLGYGLVLFLEELHPEPGSVSALAR